MNKNGLRLFLTLFLLFFLPPGMAHAEGYFSTETQSQGPLTGRNQSPIMNLFYIPQVMDARTLGRGHFEAFVSYELTNTLENDANNNFSVNYDLEIHRTAFHFTFGILDSLDIHLEIPTLAFDDGFLDSFLTNYHDAFNLPDSGRSITPENAYSYFVSENGTTVVAYQPQPFSLSDINLDLKWQIVKEAAWPGVVLRSGIKFPSGKFENGTGSGEFDYSVGMAISKSFKRFHVWGGLDGVIIEDPEPLRHFIDGEIIHYYLGGEWALIKDYLSAVVQFDGETTPFTHTGLPQFDHEILEIVPGFKGALFDHKVFWQAALREDVISHSGVDFTATFNLGFRI